MKLEWVIVLLAVLAMLSYPYILGNKLPARELTARNVSLPAAETGEEIELMRNASGKVIIDQSHGNTVVVGENSTHTYFASLFSGAGYEIDATTGKEKFRDALLTMRSSDVLVIANPLESYNESALIGSLVKNGGTLILIGDSNELTSRNLNEISVPLGIIFNADHIYDIHRFYRNYNQPLITRFAVHNMTQNLKTVAVYDGSSVSGGVPLAFPAASAKSSKGLKELAVLSAKRFDKGYIIAAGDSDIWSNNNIFSLDNKNLLVNIINYLQEA